MALTKMNDRTKLQSFLEFDERTCDGKAPVFAERGDINGAMECRRGIRLNNNQGQTLKNGGKFSSERNQMHFNELFKAQRESKQKGLPYGMTEIGPITYVSQKE